MSTSIIEAVSNEPISPELRSYLATDSATDGSDSDRPKKRQKLETEASQELWRDALSLARVTVNLALPSDDSSISCDQPKELRLVQLYAPSPRAFYIGLRESNGRSCGHLVFSPRGSLDPLRLLIQAVKLSTPKSSYVRTVCTITEAEPSIRSAGLVLDIRILWRNSRTLYDARLNRKEISVLSELTGGTADPTVKAWSPRDFYDSVHVPNSQTAEPLPGDVEGLRDSTKLYPFQKRALQWLLRREGVDLAGNRAQCPKTNDRLPHGFIEHVDTDGRRIFVNSWLGIATSDIAILDGPGTEVSGGILAEEMGLGKTVEIIALLLSHKRKMDGEDYNFTGPDPLRKSASTIIISPQSIQQQWKSEIEEHAPGLKVLVYDGVKALGDRSTNEEIIEEILSYDVVLVTYHVLGGEIHYSKAVPERSLRYEKQYARKISPLVQTDWWRCILDECQMVESGVSHAAQVANQIPRQNAWAVSGTPLKRDAKDLFGLLMFLRLEPYSYSAQLWNTLITNHRSVFKDLFGRIALRHTKGLVKGDIQLPPQKRVVITVPFTPIEEQHYSNLFQEMCDECGLDINGAPLAEDWNPDSPAVVETMRMWLSRLRQVCLHPEVGDRNRRALGITNAPLRTVTEVLNVMIDQNDTAMRTEERVYLQSKLRRGQILEHIKRVQQALDIWIDVRQHSQRLVKESREDHAEAQRIHAESASKTDTDAKSTANLGAARMRLRNALELEHMSTFFIASAYYQLKSDDKLTEPDSDKFRELEKKEVDTYDVAKKNRREILVETHERASMFMNEIRSRAKTQEFVLIPNFQPLELTGGIESRNLLQKLDVLYEAINIQAEKFDDWREKMISLLLMPLVDQEDDEIQGDEYENSTKQQDEVHAYIEGLRALLADREEALTGVVNLLTKDETKRLTNLAKEGNGDAPELMLKVLTERKEVKPTPEMGNIRGLETGLRALKVSLRGNEKSRIAAEIAIVNEVLNSLALASGKQKKVVVELKTEVELFSDTMNARLDYYRQLQAISDVVAPYEEDLPEAEYELKMAEMLRKEGQLLEKIGVLKSKSRYLVHLEKESSGVETKTCIICQDFFEVGALTSCGHSFCKECLSAWWKTHHTCPMCKAPLKKTDFHQITYKPQVLSLQEETISSSSKSSSRSSSGPSSPAPPSIYSEINSTTLSSIKNVDISGSYGTKIDTLGRHILWLRDVADPGSKCIIFSQFRDFLNILQQAFQRFNIGCASIDRKTAISQFKNDPGVQCFLLHAKAHASGLNLVNATHVFLCEPLINTALELQAIARVHRIGQHSPTTVWMYLVDDTVEKTIYDISVERRLSHIGDKVPSPTKKGKEVDTRDMEDEIEVANSLEIQDAPIAKLLATGRGGEVVKEDDLWSCLFTRRPERLRPAGGEEGERAVMGFLAGEAAEGRRGMVVR